MRHRKYKKEMLTTLAALLVTGSFFTGCSRQEEVVAYVGRRKITEQEFKKRIDDLPDYYVGFISSEGGKRQYLSGMIREETLLEKSRDFDLKSKPEVVQKIEEAKRAVLLNEAVRYLMNEKIKVSDQEIKDYYERRREEFESPRQIKVSHILLEDEEKAREVLKKLRRGESFARQAREHSIDTITAVNGGDLGYVSRGELSELAPQIEEAAFQLEAVGDTSEIVRSPFGYHIIKLTGRREGKEKAFEEAKDEIRDTIQKQKFDELLDRYEKELNVRVDYDILDQIELDVDYEF